MKLVRFGTWTVSMAMLPMLERTHEMGNGASRIILLDSPDGQVDMLGSEKARRAAFSIAYNCKIYDRTASGLQTQLDALRALRGKRDKLWMQLDSGDLRWVYARLDSISGQNDGRNKLYLPLTLNFAILSQIWNGTGHGWRFDDGHYFDEGIAFDSELSFVLDTLIKTVTVPNDGNVEVDDCIMTITARLADITNLMIKRKVGGVTQEHLVYAGTIVDGDSLVIDCGTQSVKNDGVGDSANFSRGSEHKYDGWLKLEAGNNPIEVTRTGGGGTTTIDFSFNDGWA